MIKQRTSAELREMIYGIATKESRKYRSMFPTLEDFNEALDDPEYGGDLVEKVLKGQGNISKSFKKKFPNYQSLADAIAVKTKYTGKQRHDMRETAKESLKGLYRGDFDKLWNNRENLPGMISAIRGEIAAGGNVSTTKSMEDNKKLDNLLKGLKLIDTFKGIDAARSDRDMDLLIEGKIPSRIVGPKTLEEFKEQDPEGYKRLAPQQKGMWTPSYSAEYESPFLKQIMPSAEYKALELAGRSPDKSEAFFPEYSRREREGSSGFSQGVGGAKDLLRLPGRALRPIAEKVMGIDAPGLDYWEEFARPDKYKTGAQELVDELVGFQGFGGGAAKYGLSKAGQLMPAIASGINRYAKFIEPAEVIINRTAGASAPLRNKLLGSLVKELPNIGLDVAYEGTRPDDEVSSTAGALLGGGLGALAAPLASAGTRKLLDKVTGGSDLYREILAGSPAALNEELKLAKAMLPPSQVSSTGGRNQLSDLSGQLSTRSDQLTSDVDRLASGFDTRVGDEYAEILKKNKLRGQVEGEVERRLKEQLVEGAPVPYALRDQVRDQVKYEWGLFADYDHPGRAANRGMIASPELVSTQNMPLRYAEESLNLPRPARESALESTADLTGANITLDELRDAVSDNVPPLGGTGKISQFSGRPEYKEWSDSFQPSTISAADHKTLKERIARASSKTGLLDILSDIKSGYPGQSVTSSTGDLPVDYPFPGRAVKEPVRTADVLKESYPGSPVTPESAMRKRAVNGFLQKTPAGRNIASKLEQLNRSAGLQGKLPDLSDGAAVDDWLDNIGSSRMDISTKANAFEDAVKVTKRDSGCYRI